MAQAVDRVLSDPTWSDFSTPVRKADVERLMASMHAHFESSFQRCEDLWGSYLLPPGQQPIVTHPGGRVGMDGRLDGGVLGLMM